MTEYRVAVRALAEFCHRRGDIDYRFTPSPTGSEGIAGHQLLTAGRGDTYQAEYSLSITRDFDEFSLEISGTSPVICSWSGTSWMPRAALSSA